MLPGDPRAREAAALQAGLLPGAVGIVFGAGGQTSASTDGGDFVAKARAYFQSGPVPLCR